MNITKEKTALVTGATKGIGRAISFALAKEGYRLIACARTPESLEQLRKSIMTEYPNAEVLVQSCDFSVSNQAKELLLWVATNHLQVEVLVNNVGYFIPGSILDEDDDLLAKSMQVNLYTPHTLSVYLGRQMRDRKRGHIFNISSVVAKNAIATAASYSITKWALSGLTSVLREDLKKYNVKVTEIIPGSTLTSSWEGTTIPEDEFVSPKDIAQALITILNMSAGANVDEIVIKPVGGQI